MEREPIVWVCYVPAATSGSFRRRPESILCVGRPLCAFSMDPGLRPEDIVEGDGSSVNRQGRYLVHSRPISR